MIAFLLTQIAKIKAAISTITGNMTNYGYFKFVDLGTIEGSGGSISLTAVNGTKAVVFTFGVAAKMTVINVNAPNASTVYALKQGGNDISIATEGLTLTVSNTTQYSCTAIALIMAETLTKG